MKLVGYRLTANSAAAGTGPKLHRHCIQTESDDSQFTWPKSLPSDMIHNSEDQELMYTDNTKFGEDEAGKEYYHTDFNSFTPLGPAKSNQNFSNVKKMGFAHEFASYNHTCNDHFHYEANEEASALYSSKQGSIDGKVSWMKDGMPLIDRLIHRLRICRRKGDLIDANHVHLHICNFGLEALIVLGNHIVTTFMECGSVFDAHRVFSKLMYRSVHSWTSLMLGYADNDQPQYAFDVYKRMQEDSVAPSTYTFVALLKACWRLNNVEEGMKLHTTITTVGFENDIFVGSAVLSMYAKCGSLSDAQEIFEKLPSRNIVSWTSLLTGYTEHGCFQEALKCFELLQHDNISPDAAVLMCILKACGSNGVLQNCNEIYNQVIQIGIEDDVWVGSTLVDVYAKCDAHAEAEEVFNKLLARNAVTWTTLFAGYCDSGFPHKALECFEQMQLGDLSPDPVMFTCLIKASSSIVDLNKGRELHKRCVEWGFEREHSLTDALVYMYAACGSSAEARKVFQELTTQLAISWTCLIKGFAESGLDEEVLKCYYQMQAENVAFDAVTFSSVLRTFGTLEAMCLGQVMHRESVERGVEGDLFLGSSLVSMYVKCGSVAEAWEVFNKTIERDVVTWNALMTGFSEHGPYRETIKCFDMMKTEGFSPNAVTYACCLKALGLTGMLDKGRELHMEATTKGYEKDESVSSSLIDMFGKCGSITEAQKVLDKLHIRNTVAWGAIIHGYVEHGLYEDALMCMKKMELEGICLDAGTLPAILKACSNMRAIDEGRDTYVQITCKAFESDTFVGCALVDMFVSCGMLSDAHNVLFDLSIQNIIAWNAIIAGHVEDGSEQEALACLYQLQQSGISPNAFTYGYSLRACCSLNAFDKSEELHKEIVERGFEGDIFVGDTLVEIYAKDGSYSEAWKVFNMLPNRTVESWNAIISGFADHGCWKEALGCFDRMRLGEVSPDTHTYLYVLNSCECMETIKKGLELHAEITYKGFETDTSIGNALVDMYAKCHILVDAQDVFEKLPDPDVVSWNTIITAYAAHGLRQEALKMFRRMQLEGFPESVVTLVCLLKACSSTLDIGQEIYTYTVVKGHERDGFISSVLLDIYVKHGLLLEAHKIFDSMAVKNVVSWNTMIKGYGINHDGNMAVQLFKDMQKHAIFPDKITFNCVLTACSRASQIQKAKEIFKLMRENYGIEPGFGHLSCMIDLLARSGGLHDAVSFLESLPSSPSKVMWITLLSACKTHIEENLGLRCFQQLINCQSVYGIPYVLTGSIPANTGRLYPEQLIEETRKSSGTKKMPANVSTTVDNKVYDFWFDTQQSLENHSVIQSLSEKEKYVPNLDLVHTKE